MSRRSWDRRGSILSLELAVRNYRKKYLKQKLWKNRCLCCCFFFLRTESSYVKPITGVMSDVIIILSSILSPQIFRKWKLESGGWLTQRYFCLFYHWTFRKMKKKLSRKKKNMGYKKSWSPTHVIFTLGYK